MDLFSKIITGIVAVSTAIVTVAMVVSKNQQSSQYISDYTYSPNQNYRQQQQYYNNNTTPMMNGTFNNPMGDMNVSRRNNHGVYGNNMNSYQNPYQYNSYVPTYPQYNNYNGYVNQQPMSYNNNNNQQYAYAYGYGYGYSDNNIQQNPYQSNPYQTNQYQSNPYQSNPYQTNQYQSNPYQSPYQNNQNNKYGQCPDETNYTQYNCYTQHSTGGCVSPDNYGVYNEPPRQPIPDNNSNFGSYNVDEINPSKFNQPTNVANNNYQQTMPQNNQSMGITSFVKNGDVGDNDNLIRDLMGKMEVVT